MTQKLVWILIATTLAGTATACGQELALPTRPDDDASTAAGPVDGTTGAAGEPGETDKPGKLVTIDQSAYGVGGASGGKPAGTSRGGSAQGGATARGGSGLAAAGGDGEGGSAGEPPVVARTAQLLFSEYVEGSKSNKALEILALSGGSLEGCELQTYSNGKTEPSRLALHGSLESGEVTTLCTKDLAEAEPTRCARSTSLLFNGDDALALSCREVLHDTFGEIGVDPGESWGVGATVDHTLQRRCSVTQGRVDAQQAFVIDAEWTTFGVDTFSDLGKRSCD